MMLPVWEDVSGDRIRYADLFLRFKSHYGFEVTFCNPDSGNEKGDVENKVGYVRRNLLATVPSFTDIEAFNQKLLTQSEGWESGAFQEVTDHSRPF
jgi:transposase